MERAARFRNCAQCIEMVTVQLLTARRQAAAWAAIFRCLGSTKRIGREGRMQAQELAGTVSYGTRSASRYGTTAPGCSSNSMNPAMHLTRDLVNLVGRSLHLCALPSTAVVCRARVQPPRHELPADILQSGGDRNRALRAWKRSRRQQAATQHQVTAQSTVRATGVTIVSSNGRHYGETKRRR